MNNPRKGWCLCGEEATIRDTKAADGRLHFVCHDLTETGRPKHYGFVDASDAEKVEDIKEEKTTDRFGFFKKDKEDENKPTDRFGFPIKDNESEALGGEFWPRSDGADESNEGSGEGTSGRFSLPIFKRS